MSIGAGAEWDNSIVPGVDRKLFGLCGSSETVAKLARFMCGRAIKPVRPPMAPTISLRVKSFRSRYLRPTADSFRFLMLQNAARVAFQSKTRHGLQGPFVGGYLETFRSRPAGFFDGDSFLTNFAGHPVQGATTYHLARINGGSREQAFWWVYSTRPSSSSALWEKRLSAMCLSRRSILSRHRPQVLCWE